MPLKSRETSNLPESVGGRVALAEGAAVGVGEGASISSARVIVQRQRSNEIQRSVIATKSEQKMRRTIRRSVPSPSFRTRLFPQPGCNRDNNAASAQARHQSGDDRSGAPRLNVAKDSSGNRQNSKNNEINFRPANHQGDW